MIARFTYLLLVLVAALVVAACGGDDDASDDTTTTETPATETTTEDTTTETEGGETEGEGTTLELANKGDELEYDKTELTAPAGSITIRLTNDSSIPHDVVVEGYEDQASELVQNGDTTETTVELEPGTYTYYCTPHKAAGMTGTLTVT